jgi:hypothetical protein
MKSKARTSCCSRSRAGKRTSLPSEFRHIGRDHASLGGSAAYTWGCNISLLRSSRGRGRPRHTRLPADPLGSGYQIEMAIAAQ